MTQVESSLWNHWTSSKLSKTLWKRMGNILSAGRMDGTAPATGGMGASLGMKAWHTSALPLDLLCSFVATAFLLQQNNITNLFDEISLLDKITKQQNLLIC